MNESDQSESILEGICIAMPCNVRWDEMKGDNKIRLCGGCNKNVYNISQMSKVEAEELLAAPVLPCIQISRTDSGAIVTHQKTNIARWFWTSGKTAVSAVLSLIATFAPQWASAADEKLKAPMLAGKPAVITPHNGPSKELTKQQIVPALPGVPIYMPKTPNASNLWPASISGLGFSKEDLPLAYSEKFSADQINAIDSKNISLDAVPSQLDKTAWEYFFKARKFHLKAAMRLVNKEMDKAMQDCQESQKLYRLALEQIARGKHDQAFAALVYQEQNKIAQMEDQCRKCQTNAAKSS